MQRNCAQRLPRKRKPKVMPPSSAQVKFFTQLTDDRQFPAGQEVSTLRTTFSGLSQDAASQWIEKAMKLPKKDTGEGDSTPPPF